MDKAKVLEVSASLETCTRWRASFSRQSGVECSRVGLLLSHGVRQTWCPARWPGGCWSWSCPVGVGRVSSVKVRVCRVCMAELCSYKVPRTPQAQRKLQVSEGDFHIFLKQKDKNSPLPPPAQSRSRAQPRRGSSSCDSRTSSLHKGLEREAEQGQALRPWAQARLALRSHPHRWSALELRVLQVFPEPNAVLGSDGSHQQQFTESAGFSPTVSWPGCEEAYVGPGR